MRALYTIIVSGLLAGACAIREPAAEHGTATEPMQIVSGGQVCRATKTVKSRIRKVQCQGRTRPSGQALSSLECRGDPGLCALIRNRRLHDDH